MMVKVRPRVAGTLWVAGIAVFSSLLLLVVLSGSARAEEKQFCYGANVSLGTACESSNWDMTGAYAVSPDASVCMSIAEFYNCSKGGAGDGLYMDPTPNANCAAYTKARIFNQFVSGPQKVYGTFWTGTRCPPSEPKPPARGGIDFQSNATHLFQWGAPGNMDWGLGMMAGSSPSIAHVSGGYQLAMVSNGGGLWTVGPLGYKSWELSVREGTSPSITRNGSGFLVAYQAPNSRLMIVNSNGAVTDTGQGMAAGTSPSIINLTGGGYQIAFQSNAGELFLWGDASKGSTGQGMKAGTSPSISALNNGGWQAAFQSNAGELFLWGDASKGSTGQGMNGGTSPSIAGLEGGGWEAIFQSNAGELFIWGTVAKGGTGQGMRANTSPSIDWIY